MIMSVILLINIQVYDTALILQLNHIFMTINPHSLHPLHFICTSLVYFWLYILEF